MGGEEDVSVLFTIIARMFYKSIDLRYTGEKYGIRMENRWEESSDRTYRRHRMNLA